MPLAGTRTPKSLASFSPTSGCSLRRVTLLLAPFTLYVASSVGLFEALAAPCTLLASFPFQFHIVLFSFSPPPKSVISKFQV